ncbi:MAG: hypothetical protein RLZZ490_2131 [Cyanobacteriota bacterium]
MISLCKMVLIILVYFHNWICHPQIGVAFDSSGGFKLSHGAGMGRG